MHKLVYLDISKDIPVATNLVTTEQDYIELVSETASNSIFPNPITFIDADAIHFMIGDNQDVIILLPENEWYNMSLEDINDQIQFIHKLFA